MRRIRINVNNDDPWKIKIIEGSTSSSRVYSGEKKGETIHQKDTASIHLSQIIQNRLNEDMVKSTATYHNS